MGLRYRLEYLALRAAAGGVPRLSTAQRERVGAALGNVLSRIGPRQRRIESNLRLVFPERSAEWIAATARENYRHVVREALQTLRLSTAARADVSAMAEVTGAELLSAAIAAGSGAVLVGAHLGNWEVGFAALAVRGLPLNLVYKPQANPLVHCWALRARERWGIRQLNRDGVLAAGYRKLAAREVLLLVADQHASWRKGVELPFFGRVVSAHRGPAVFAYRGKVPLFYFSCIRQAADRYHLHVEQITPVYQGGETEPYAVRAMTLRYLERLEQDIVRWPEQYFWMHRRWRRLEQQAK